MGNPTAIGIRKQHDVAADGRAHRLEALDILVGVETDLHLQPAIAFRHIGLGA